MTTPSGARRAPTRRPTRTLVAALAALLAIAPAAALDPPASQVNPKTGAIEIADPVQAPSAQDIRYVLDAGDRVPTVEVVTDDPADDRSPRLAIAPDGDAWVVWWRDLPVDRVLVRTRDHATGSWGAIREVGEAGESASRPDVVHDGTRAWIAYEIAGAAGTRSIAATIVDDEPDPVGARVVVGSSAGPAPLDVQIHAAGGEVWVSWVHDHDEVGWSQRDAASGTWSLAAYESYANDTVENARQRIRATVTGN